MSPIGQWTIEMHVERVTASFLRDCLSEGPDVNHQRVGVGIDINRTPRPPPRPSLSRPSSLVPRPSSLVSLIRQPPASDESIDHVSGTACLGVQRCSCMQA